MANKQRLFIASPLPKGIQEPLQALYEQRATWENALSPSSDSSLALKWAPPHQWHLTWLFLGHVPAEQLSSIQEKLSASLQAQPAVSLKIQRIGLWPTASRARILACHLQTTPKLEAMALRIQAALPEFTDSKRFKPHITLARLKNARPGQLPRQWAGPELSLPAAELTDITLYASTLTPTGAIHTALQSISLT